MAFSIMNKTALVTGAGRRIGKATAIRLGAEGANVILHYNSSEKEAAEIANIIREKGRKAWTIQADLADSDVAGDFFSCAVECAGSVDILINNASIFPKTTLDTLTPENFFHNITVNALSPFLLARSFSQQEREGVVINMLDTKIVDYEQEHAAYQASKRILFTLTRMTAMEYAPKIRVNGVAPGLILPPEGEDESYLQRRASSNLLNKWGHPDDIADAILFLIRSDFVTGQVLFVDGGKFMKGMTYGL